MGYHKQPGHKQQDSYQALLDLDRIDDFVSCAENEEVEKETRAIHVHLIYTYHLFLCLGDPLCSSKYNETGHTASPPASRHSAPCLQRVRESDQGLGAITTSWVPVYWTNFQEISLKFKLCWVIMDDLIFNEIERLELIKSTESKWTGWLQGCEVTQKNNKNVKITICKSKFRDQICNVVHLL